MNIRDFTKKFKLNLAKLKHIDNLEISKNKQSVLLFAEYSSWGACSNFNEMFNMSEEYQSWEILETPNNKDGYSFGRKMNKRKLSIRNKLRIKKLSSVHPEIVFIFDYNGIKVFERFLKITGTKYSDFRVFVFWTGTPYVKNHYWCNQWTQDNSVTAFAMCDLLRFSQSSIPLMQPYNLEYFKRISDQATKQQTLQKIKLCHSPGHKGSSNEKGSLTIQEVVSNFDGVVLKQIGNQSKFLNHEDCLIEKSKCDVFIDKLGPNCAGGIGKSGIESIMLGKPTICSMHNSIKAKPYDSLPIIDINCGSELSDFLEEIQGKPDILKSIIEKTINYRNTFSYNSTLDYLNEYIK
jgi:hypothetical protein